MIRAFANNTDPKFRYSISTVLAEWQTHDDRLFEILIDQLRREPSYSASNLAIYGDPRAVPHLLEALDRYTIVESQSPLANHALIELRAAIEQLGGTLTTEQQLKCRRGREPAEVFSRKLDAMLESRRREVIWSRPLPRARNRPPGPRRVLPSQPRRLRPLPEGARRTAERGRVGHGS